MTKGSGVPHNNKVGKITRDQVREIATTKLPDLNANDVEAAMKIVEGTARSWASLVSNDDGVAQLQPQRKSATL